MLMIQSAQAVLARRRKVLMDLEKEIKKAKKQNGKQTKNKNIAVGSDNSEAPIEEITEENTDLDEIEKKFNTISQTVRRELEHFDFVMREEFEKAFGSYSATYWSSLSKTKVLDISDTTPQHHTEMLALTNEPITTEYEDMTAMSYHM